MTLTELTKQIKRTCLECFPEAREVFNKNDFRVAIRACACKTLTLMNCGLPLKDAFEHAFEGLVLEVLERKCRLTRSTESKNPKGTQAAFAMS